VNELHVVVIVSQVPENVCKQSRKTVIMSKWKTHDLCILLVTMYTLRVDTTVCTYIEPFSLSDKPVNTSYHSYCMLPCTERLMNQR